ncbi:hypothetical protein [Mesoterricola silvestris]|uniref:Uncharacterized protein n=1 Tax=Mesoterricola silvestris TaxID=2927979 RepID=A0AA48GGD4_9BACT|nr:hypothetical protein [Mesoterricola silvestris]BDU72296.1 hypothetical protein METEAL_14700 [Mesoterricola silvestris]
MSQPHDPFQNLPDSARLWLVALDRPLSGEARARLQEGMEAILGQWRHKGHAYQGAFALVRDRILAVAEPDLASAPSGCAIDGMLRKVRHLVAGLDLGEVDAASAVLVDAGGLRAVPKAELEARLQDGSLGPDTPVLDLSLYTVGDLRAGKLEAPLARTWIGRKFKVA